MPVVAGTEQVIRTRLPLDAGVFFLGRSAVIECPHYFQDRTQIAKQNIASPPAGQLLPLLKDIFFQVADVAWGNAFPAGGRDYLIVRNTNPSVTRTAIVRSIAEPQFLRTGDVQIVADPGCDVWFGPIGTIGFKQNDGNIWINADCVDIEFAILTFN